MVVNHNISTTYTPNFLKYFLSLAESRSDMHFLSAPVCWWDCHKNKQNIPKTYWSESMHLDCCNKIRKLIKINLYTKRWQGWHIPLCPEFNLMAMYSSWELVGTNYNHFFLGKTHYLLLLADISISLANHWIKQLLLNRWLTDNIKDLRLKNKM